MFCTECGQEVRGSHEFCVNCGAAASDDHGDLKLEKENEQDQHRARAPLGVVALLAAGLVIALGIAFGVPGGGGSTSAEDTNLMLTTQERVTVAGFELNAANTVLDGSEYGELLDSIDKVIALARKKPNAKYDGRTMRQVLSDQAGSLVGYQDDLSKKLELAIETLPVTGHIV